MKASDSDKCGRNTSWEVYLWSSVANLALSVSIQTYLWYKRRVARSRELPFPNIPYVVPDPHWLLGHVKLVGAGIIDGQRRLLVDHAGGDKLVSTCFMLNIPTFTTLDAQLMNRILMASSVRTGAAGTVLHFRRLFGDDTILMQNGVQWKESRIKLHRALQQALSSSGDSGSAIAGGTQYSSLLQSLFYQASVQVTESLCQQITSETSSTTTTEMDAVAFFRQALLDVVGSSMFGHDFTKDVDDNDKNNNNKIDKQSLLNTILYLQQELTRRAYEDRLSLLAQFYWIPSPANRRHARERLQFRNTLKRIIQQRRRRQQQQQQQQQQAAGKDSSPDTPKLFIDYILQHGASKEQEEKEAEDNDDQLADWLQTVLIGSFDTTAIALSNTIHLLCKHSYFQQECRKEARRVLASRQNSSATTTSITIMDWDATQDLPLITACFFEALRLYPPATITTRNLTRPFEFTLDGRVVQLEKYTRIVCPFYWINRCAQHFARPNDFLPTRWAQRRRNDGTWESRTSDNDRGGTTSGVDDGDAYHAVEIGKPSFCLSFSAGARDCVGRSMAMTMGPTILAVLLKTVQFELTDPEYEIELERCGGNAVAKGGIPVRVSIAP